MEDLDYALSEEEMGLPQIVSGLPQKVRQVKIPRLPPIPVWDDHISALKILVGDFKCITEVDFARGKGLREKASKLNAQIESGSKEVKQAIDAMKAPVLEAEKRDLAAIANLTALLDAEAGAWKLEQDRIAAKAAEEARQAKITAQKAEQAKEAEFQRQWGDEEEAKKIEEAPIVAPRASTPKSAYTYAKGVSVKPVLKFKVTNPSQVERRFCTPDLPAINRHVQSWAATVKDPTKEQREALAKEIGGGEVNFE